MTARHVLSLLAGLITGLSLQYAEVAKYRAAVSAERAACGAEVAGSVAEAVGECAARLEACREANWKNANVLAAEVNGTCARLLKVTGQ